MESKQLSIWDDTSPIVKEIESKYPEMTNEYKRIMLEGYETFCKKQSNYGPDNIAVGTSLRTEEDIRLSLTGLFFRMNDKIQRIKQLIVFQKKDNVAEPVKDTFMDLGVYAIIAQIVISNKWGK